MSISNAVKRKSSVKRSTFITGLAAVVVVTLFTSPMYAGNNDRAFECNDRTIEGTYGIQVTGTRAVPPPLGGGTELVIGVVIRTYDGLGNFSQIGNVKGSVTGITPDQPGSGTYVVSANCTAITFFQPAPGVVLEERMVIVHDGSELRTMVLSPSAVMVTGVHKRIDRQ